ncbi:MAG: hypothetical protein QOE05_2382 [Actinomycetota bacterium]|jgi:hypothetical protein|nr:hypothetical protein [Actinomycetota bacterium]
MTIPDQIRQSVDAATDQPVDGQELLRRVRRRTMRSPLVAPLAAAAAVALVAGGTTYAVQRDQHGGTGQRADGSGIVPFVQQQPGDDDVPPPDLRGPHSGPPPFFCTKDLVAAALAWHAEGSVLQGAIRISLKDPAPQARGCLLENGDPMLTLLGPADGPVGPESTYAGVRNAPLRPALPRRYVAPGTPVVIPVTLAGSNCVPSDWAGLSGMDPDLLLQFSFEGDPLPCDTSQPTADGTLALGVPHTKGEPGGDLPPDRKGLEVILELPEQVREHESLHFRVRVTNPTAKDIALAPCPTYEVTFTRVDSDGSTYFGNGGRLNCDAAPEAVPAGGEVVFAMVQSDLQSDQPGAKDAPELSVKWGIAGPRAAIGDVRFAHTEPTRAPVAGPPSLAELFAEAGPYPGKPWEKYGEPVPPQDLSLAQGPSHCQWEGALFLGGAVLPAGKAGREWTRDPEGVLTHYPRSKQEFQAHATLPDDAAPTGYTRGDVELWLAPSDEGAYVYLVNARDRTDVERWVNGGGGCA